MHINQNPTFLNICQVLRQDKRIKRFCVPGECRMWSAIALELIQDIAEDDSTIIFNQALEVTVQPGLLHTFVCVAVVDNDQVVHFIFDGVGVLDELPYFGNLKDAPSHLMGGKPDPINLYRKSRIQRMNGGEMTVSEVVANALHGKSIANALRILAQLEGNNLPEGELSSELKNAFAEAPGQIRDSILNLVLQEGGIDLQHMMIPRGLNRRFVDDLEIEDPENY